MDLSLLQAAETAEFVPNHPISGDPLDIKIFLVGSDTAEFKALVRQRMASNLLKDQQTKGKNNAKDAARIEAELMEAEKRSVDLLVKCTKGWDNVEWEGKALKFSAENAAMLYSNPTLSWLREQVDKFIADRGNFIKS
jgi:hypothetical protein